jgi:hypothetical protein
MNYLQKITVALGIEPNIAIAALGIVSTFLVLITILYICVPFFLLRIRKEIIEINKNLRTLYILETQTKNIEKHEVVNNEDKFINDEKPTGDIIKLQLDDDDIQKLKNIGLDMD